MNYNNGSSQGLKNLSQKSKQLHIGEKKKQILIKTEERSTNIFSPIVSVNTLGSDSMKRNEIIRNESKLKIIESDFLHFGKHPNLNKCAETLNYETKKLCSELEEADNILIKEVKNGIKNDLGTRKGVNKLNFSTITEKEVPLDKNFHLPNFRGIKNGMCSSVEFRTPSQKLPKKFFTNSIKEVTQNRKNERDFLKNFLHEV